MSFLRPILRRVNTGAIAYRQASFLRNTPRTVSAWRCYSSGETESDEAFDARWVAYFDNPELDAWELKKGLNELYGHDLVPEPKIVVAMLNAARRLNDVAMAIRILEAVKEKAAGNTEIYSYIIEQVKPTLEEIGVATPDELGLA